MSNFGKFWPNDFVIARSNKKLLLGISTTGSVVLLPVLGSGLVEDYYKPRPSEEKP